jgi:hypothetical protein
MVLFKVVWIGFKKPIRIGFTAQAPISESSKAVFTDIRFEEKAITDSWQGE